MKKKHTFFSAECSPSRGFTLIEMLVVLFIMLTMLFVVLVNYPEFFEQKSFELFVQDVAQTAREAQVYALPTQGISNQFVDFGIYYTSAAERIVFFADVNSDEVFDPNDVIVRDILVPDPITIQGVVDNTAQEVLEFTAIYKRPNLEPVISAQRADGSTVEAGYVRITFAGPSGTRAVEISGSGQIAVRPDI